MHLPFFHTKIQLRVARTRGQQTLLAADLSYELARWRAEAANSSFTHRRGHYFSCVFFLK